MANDAKLCDRCGHPSTSHAHHGTGACVAIGGCVCARFKDYVAPNADPFVDLIRRASSQSIPPVNTGHIKNIPAEQISMPCRDCGHEALDHTGGGPCGEVTCICQGYRDKNSTRGVAKPRLSDLIKPHPLNTLIPLPPANELPVDPDRAETARCDIVVVSKDGLRTDAVYINGTLIGRCTAISQNITPSDAVHLSIEMVPTSVVIGDPPNHQPLDASEIEVTTEDGTPRLDMSKIMKRVAANRRRKQKPEGTDEGE